MNSEILNQIASNSIYLEGVAKNTMKYCSEVFERWLKPGSILELGPAEGYMTDLLYKDANSFAEWSNGEKYTVVEGSQVFSDMIAERFPQIEVVTSFFEDYSTEYKYDNIVLGHVLEHVDDPVYVLKLCRKWLVKDGRILAAVPNANSLHRQAAVKMGMLDSKYSFSEKDKRHGHQRVFDMESFRDGFIKAGLKVVKQGGYWLKTLSDRQIDESWNEQMIDAYLQLGEEYPDIAGEIYIIAE